MADYKPANGYEYKPQTVEYNNTTTNTTSTTVPKKQSKMKQNFRKFWWLHLLNFVIGTILISMLLTYVALPNIAQSDVNKAEMEINEQIISEPTADEVKLHIVSTVRSKSLFTPTLDGFEASLFLENTMPNIKPFGKINIPSVHATKVSSTTVDQQMKILDQEQFIRYNTLVSQAKSFRLAVRGRTKLHLGALPVVTVDFNKVVNMTGLNSFAGISIKDIKISILPEPDGTNMNGTIIIPNPTVMTLTIGDMIQNITSGGQYIGETTIRNVVLKPGNNEFPMSTKSEQVTVLNILQADKSKNGTLPIEARTVSIVHKGQHLSYFEAAMRDTPIKLDLKLRDALTAAGLDLFGPSSSGSGTGGGVGLGSSDSTSSLPSAGAGSSTPDAAGSPVPAPSSSLDAAGSPAPAPAPAPPSSLDAAGAGAAPLPPTAPPPPPAVPAAPAPAASSMAHDMPGHAR